MHLQFVDGRFEFFHRRAGRRDLRSPRSGLLTCLFAARHAGGGTTRDKRRIFHIIRALAALLTAVIIVEITVEGLHIPVFDEIKLINTIAQQVAIVGDQHDRAAKFLQGQGQSLAHFQIEVIGGLVK